MGEVEGTAEWVMEAIEDGRFRLLLLDDELVPG